MPALPGIALREADQVIGEIRRHLRPEGIALHPGRMVQEPAQGHPEGPPHLRRTGPQGGGRLRLHLSQDGMEEEAALVEQSHNAWKEAEG